MLLESVILGAIANLPPDSAIVVAQLYKRYAGETSTQLSKRRILDTNADLG